MTCTDSEAIGEIPGPSWPSSVNKRIGLIHSALKQLHLMGTEGAPTQLEELFRIIGAWLIKSRLTIILFLFWSSFQKMHTLPPPLLAYSISGRLRPLPLFLLGALCLKVFFSPWNLRFYFIYFFPDHHVKVSSASPHYFPAGLGEITNLDCVGLPAKTWASKLAGKRACISLPNGECYWKM